MNGPRKAQTTSLRRSIDPNGTQNKATPATERRPRGKQQNRTHGNGHALRMDAGPHPGACSQAPVCRISSASGLEHGPRSHPERNFGTLGAS